ncbi:MAG: molecular chaperone DnaJ [Deltaproteobacteria bacterium HGW-Deltaproteobacteria-4]|nr:MAG: molecular chaperone DnaJ [Deltaproteobacteria bacterium HGW-Deltaproteobacteria-4]
MTYTDLQEALRVLELEERVTLKEIKTRHKELVKRYHPDTGNTDEPEKIRQVNAAYQIVLEYVALYHFSFSREEFYEQNPEERLRQQFADDPVWGRK